MISVIKDNFPGRKLHTSNFEYESYEEKLLNQGDLTLTERRRDGGREGKREREREGWRDGGK